MSSTSGLREAADRLDGVSNGRFQAGRVLREEPESRVMVQRAVARAKAGDRDAIRYLYVRYADSVYGYVRSILDDDYEAEDVTQHVFLKLMTSIGKYEPRGVPFLGWILRVAHNVAVDH